MDLEAVVTAAAQRDGVAALTVGVSQGGARHVVAGGRAPASGPSAYRIASLTKAFTSAATVVALRDAAIPLHVPAIEVIPSLALDWRAGPALTVEQLLGQVSGLNESVDATMMAALGHGEDALLEGARLVVAAGNRHEPGERWSYYNGNYFLVGAVLSAVTHMSYEDVLVRTMLQPWRLTRTGFDTPGAPVTGWDGPVELPGGPYPRPRRPSGGLWSTVDDLLTFAERVLNSGALLAELGRRRTRPDDPMAYGLGWALGPSGQMYLNGRLSGYRAAMLLLPDQGYGSVALANQEHALPTIARILSDLQRPFTGDELAAAIQDFAA